MREVQGQLGEGELPRAERAVGRSVALTFFWVTHFLRGFELGFCQVGITSEMKLNFALPEILCDLESSLFTGGCCVEL